MASEYSLDQLKRALGNAAEAGDTHAAMIIAEHIKSLKSSPAPAPAPAPTWGQVAKGAAQNLLPSLGRFAAGAGEAMLHPIETAENITDVGAGELQKAIPILRQTTTDPAITARADQAADRFNQFYADRYGSMARFKQTLETDPVGVVADVASVLGGIGSGTKVAALETSGDRLNPVTVASKVARPALQGAGKAAGKAASTVLGFSTGTGPDAIATAYRSGQAGDKSFLEHLRGQVDPSDVLEDMKQNLHRIVEDKNNDYVRNIQATSKDATILKFDDIDKAVKDAQAKTQFKGEVKNRAAFDAAERVSEEVDRWRQLNPIDYHTPMGLDALKQRIGGILEHIPDNERTARSVVNGVYRSIKDTIVKQSPDYAKTMQDYAEASDLIDEMQRTLSLGPGKTSDTALRKLQSVFRNNVNTNYGNRGRLLEELIQRGGKDVRPALAGQSLSAPGARGLQGYAAVPTLITGFTGHPHLLAALPFQSPRFVGSAAYKAGQGLKGLSVNKRARLAALLIERARDQENAQDSNH